MASRNGNVNQLNRSGNSISSNNLSVHPNFTRSGASPNAIPLSSSYLQTPMSSGYAPPLPVRRISPTSYGSRMGMGMGMGSYYSPYSRYPSSMYSPGFGGYHRGYGGGYGGMGGGESTFIQMAEESTRPAFESIESVVEVVSSISMMLESTYQAVHSSYSAILGVVDQFSRLKDHLTQILSIMALLRALRWLCLKVLYLLKLRKDNPSDEAAWGAAAEAAASGGFPLPPLPEKDRGSAWPFLMFVGLVIGAPWLMFKLLSKTVKKSPLDTRVFRDDQGNLITVTTAYEFKATQRDELSFSAGEKLYISPKSSRTSPNGWLFACNQKHETGLIPSNYLQIKAKTGPQINPRKQVFKVMSERVSGPLPENQVASADSVNQFPGAHPVNQVPVLQPDGSQQPFESYEDLISQDRDFDEYFGRRNLVGQQSRNSIGNAHRQPNDSDLPKNSGTIPSDRPSTSHNESDNQAENFNADPSTSDILNNSSLEISNEKAPQEVSNNKNTVAS
ncbi:hypothetical protein JTE90_011691 [Oedothorax gibbosus]|uniref:Peroxisomal membrane protein PEX13 n=1 Tax=Oedothorax gibbosus TaxID=931172 RepID=A0AAV6UVQ7_9ARAC|nr:hypothetical protein JTE90_011691 [Oedothorax gibbosus]